ncbi:hypothetical protein [Mesorhizobium sp.]|uniref:hypothetical protein n=1 Tax=Mesorhizobium sp. TaxID=1871066 RepID=UPI000FEA4475|nr:hypothetical protein [Mesorhizobium sp.]RWB68358.1 MAG: hypothetical protein EOQ49_22630 [Mesorhizobium sp.]
MAARTTQVVKETIESYSDATNLRTTQVVQETLLGYSNPATTVRATQVVIEVLRAQASITLGSNFGGII